MSDPASDSTAIQIIRGVLAGLRATATGLATVPGPPAAAAALLLALLAISDAVLKSAAGDPAAAKERLERLAELDRRITAGEIKADDALVREKIRALYRGES